jgi:hypothetical protein
MGAVSRVIGRLSFEPLPGPNDVHTRVIVLPDPGPAWARRVGARDLWLAYRFDDASVTILGVNVHQPMPL